MSVNKWGGYMKAISIYQDVFNKLVHNLKKNEETLALLVFGSLVTGDLWDGSDIDLMVVCKDNPGHVKNIYLEDEEIPVHIKLINKESFMSLGENNKSENALYKFFSGSKLVFWKDDDIRDKYNQGRYFKDVDKDRLSMVYLGRLLKDFKVLKKYLYHGGDYTAFSCAVRCMEGFARLYVNSMGYITTKDALAMASELNNQFKISLEKLFFYGDNVKEKLEGTVSFLEFQIEEMFKNSTSFLIDFIKNESRHLSAEEIKGFEVFKGFNIEMETLLNELWKRNIIKRELRDYTSENGKVLFKENVYYVS